MKSILFFIVLSLIAIIESNQEFDAKLTNHLKTFFNDIQVKESPHGKREDHVPHSFRFDYLVGHKKSFTQSARLHYSYYINEGTFPKPILNSAELHKDT